MPLILKKRKGETWHEAGLRLAKEYGLEADFEATFSECRKELSEESAAFEACYQWDLLEYEAEGP